jgi:hypothetical protein
MRASALVLVLTAALVVGCGSSKPSAPANGEASKSGAQVLADAKAAATSARSAHVSGNLEANGTQVTVNLSAVRGKGGEGSVSTNGLSFDLVRIGDAIYIKGSDAFYKHFAGDTVAQLLHGKWIKGSATSGRLKSLAPLTSVDALFAQIASHHGSLVNKGETAYKGQQVVVIQDADGSKLYVAATGKPYPVALFGNKNQPGSITFGDWNKSVSLSAPGGAIDISQFGG